MSLLAKRYARAVFEAAQPAGATEAVAADLQKVEQALADDRARAAFLDPQTSREARSAMLDKIVSGGHELTRNLVQVALRRRREALLPELYQAYRELLAEARGESRGTVESAKPLSDVQVSELETRAAAAFGHKVALDFVVNPELIGGVRLTVGTTLYDGSVATALEELERKLMEAPLP